uniref:phosphotransferase n=1 Tax=Salinispora vitiensis TaxID=999544 RepID=UPI000D6B0A65
MSSGVANHAYSLGDDLVLRIPRTAAFGADLRKEAAVIPAARNRGVRTPELVTYDDSGRSSTCRTWCSAGPRGWTWNSSRSPRPEWRTSTVRSAATWHGCTRCAGRRRPSWPAYRSTKTTSSRTP